jgi:hypothetical protein
VPSTDSRSHRHLIASPQAAVLSFSNGRLWSLTSPHEQRTSGLQKIRSSVKKDFFNTIGQKQNSSRE